MRRGATGATVSYSRHGRKTIRKRAHHGEKQEAQEGGLGLLGSHGQTVPGKVKKKITERGEVAGRTVKASEDEPQVESEKSGRTAVHKPQSLRKKNKGYELHYRRSAGVDERLEWDPALLAVRTAAEDVFLDALRRDGGSGRKDVAEAVDALQLEPVGDDGHSVSHHLRRKGELWQLREYAAVRSLCHLKEFDSTCGWCPGSGAGRRRAWSPSSSTNSARGRRRTSTRNSSPT